MSQTPIVTASLDAYQPPYRERRTIDNDCLMIHSVQTVTAIPQLITYTNRSRVKSVYGSVKGRRHLIKSHRDATGPYSMTAEVRGTGEGTLECTVRDKSSCSKSPQTSTSTFVGCFFPPPSASTTPPVDLIAEATNYARIKARQKYLGTEAEGLAILGEARETLKSLRSPLESIRDLCFTTAETIFQARNQRKAGRVSGKGYRRKINKAYLEYTFALKPFLGDIEDLAHAAASLAFRHTRIRGVGGASSATLYEGIAATTLGGDTCYYTAVTNTTTTAKVTIIGERKIGPQDEDTVSALNAAFGMRPEQVPSALWEVTPFSFIIDYFVNIGPFIEALSAGRATLAWGNQSTLWKRRIDKTGGACGNPNTEPTSVVSRDCSGTPGAAFAEAVAFSRASIDDVDFPHISFSLPDWKQALNISSILYQIKDKNERCRR